MPIQKNSNGNSQPIAKFERLAKKPQLNIIGISAGYHDSACCLLQDGELVAAVQEERFTRKKHDASFPKFAVEYCLGEGELSIGDVDFVAFYEKRTSVNPGEYVARHHLAIFQRFKLAFTAARFECHVSYLCD